MRRFLKPGFGLSVPYRAGAARLPGKDERVSRVRDGKGEPRGEAPWLSRRRRLASTAVTVAVTAAVLSGIAFVVVSLLEMSRLASGEAGFPWATVACCSVLIALCLVLGRRRFRHRRADGPDATPGEDG